MWVRFNAGRMEIRYPHAIRLSVLLDHPTILSFLLREAKGE